MRVKSSSDGGDVKNSTTDNVRIFGGNAVVVVDFSLYSSVILVKKSTTDNVRIFGGIVVVVVDFFVVDVVVPVAADAVGFVRIDDKSKFTFATKKYDLKLILLTFWHTTLVITKPNACIVNDVKEPIGISI